MKQAPQKLELYRSKTKGFLFLLVSLVFVFGGMWSINEADHQTDNPPMLMKFMGYSAVIFFGLGALIFFASLFRKRPYYVLDSNGLLLIPFIGKEKWIAWEKIADIGIAKVENQEFIVLYLWDLPAYLKDLHGYRAWKARANIRHYGSPFIISASGLKIKTKDLIELMRERVFMKAENG